MSMYKINGLYVTRRTRTVLLRWVAPDSSGSDAELEWYEPSLVHHDRPWMTDQELRAKYDATELPLTYSGPVDETTLMTCLNPVRRALLAECLDQIARVRP
ncbi:hypothetical protein [Bifidobacterium bombi]|uniref:Uncharacterized protein n=1 Tax=Bifidobacterium bombi DSM 19703 TaxID=1341695 RepID=A0A080N3P7_9BIFI|nr:hypothetical protein [Bifidobacterium bombi]KFF31666.1 hypothetical protein BBOMB_1053 [Bifidobacterium bombi DSM 19703]